MTKRILGVSVNHPRPGQGPSHIEVNIDRGLASGKIDSYEIDVDEALDLAEQLLHSARIVKRVNGDRGYSIPNQSDGRAS